MFDLRQQGGLKPLAECVAVLVVERVFPVHQDTVCFSVGVRVRCETHPFFVLFLTCCAAH